ncbi:hypothetical protein [Pyxidicoccus sp. MSG2]|uniref:hypothetical protein n=1 Tax=Pyxidicoccus sp. MSG2 TaxID=2996790 RepID=UPI0022706E43|nr:hypothetical protein [Pyxidicoccus sp. MSG2]MCY1019445.1 hypothetical protein [Pyxidicoccus sp. MSG2]
MNQLEHDPELADDCPDLDADSTRKMRRVVWGRRARDKVNPFQRWARAVTADLPRDVRLSHVRGALPEGLIGEHALSHLSWDTHFESTAERELREARQRAWRLQRRWRALELDRGLLATLLRRLLLLPGGQRAFNDYLKRACAMSRTLQRGHDGRRHRVLHGPGPIRLLLGTHDVRPFLAVLTRPTWGAPPTAPPPMLPEAHRAAHDFLRAFHQQRGDLAATLAALPVPPLFR